STRPSRGTLTRIYRVSPLRLALALLRGVDLALHALANLVETIAHLLSQFLAQSATRRGGQDQAESCAERRAEDHERSGRQHEVNHRSASLQVDQMKDVIQVVSDSLLPH